MLLFGSLLAWAVYDRIAVKRRGDPGAPCRSAGRSTTSLVVGIGTVAYLAMFWLHDSVIGVTAA